MSAPHRLADRTEGHIKAQIKAQIKARIEAYAGREWQRRGALAWALWPLSWLFGALAGLRRTSFALGWRKSVRVGVPVVIVGNVTVGGTGKTPTVIALVDGLRAAGFTPRYTLDEGLGDTLTWVRRIEGMGISMSAGGAGT